MNIIKDPNQIRYRTALQLERDYQVDNLAHLLEEMRPKMQQRNQQNQEILRPDEEKYLRKRTRDAAEPHLELVFGSDWTRLPRKFKDKVINDSASALIAISALANESVYADMRLNAPGLMENILRTDYNQAITQSPRQAPPLTPAPPPSQKTPTPPPQTSQPSKPTA